jgi:hypothetical protein
MFAAMQHIRSTPRDWDMIELRWVASEGVQGGKTARAMRVANMFSEKDEYQVTSLVDLPATFEEFIAGKSNSLRRQFKRTMRDLFADGRAEYIRHRPDSAGKGDGDPAPRQVIAEDDGGDRVGDALLGAFDNVGREVVVATGYSVVCDLHRLFRHLQNLCGGPAGVDRCCRPR